CAPASNPAVQGSVKAGTHGVPWGGRLRPGLAGAQAGLPCAPPRREKNAAATGRGRGGSRYPVVRHTARPEKNHRTTPGRSALGGVGGRVATTLHASPRQSLQA